MPDGESPAESDDGGEAAVGAASFEGEVDVNPDLFYRMKLKLYDRDRITGMVRTPYDKLTTEDKSHWGVGTRIVITEPGDMYEKRAGRILEYRCSPAFPAPPWLVSRTLREKSACTLIRVPWTLHLLL